MRTGNRHLRTWPHTVHCSYKDYWSMESVSTISIKIYLLNCRLCSLMVQQAVWHRKAARVCLHVRHLLFLKLLMCDKLASCIMTFRVIIYLTALLVSA